MNTTKPTSKALVRTISWTLFATTLVLVGWGSLVELFGVGPLIFESWAPKRHRLEEVEFAQLLGFASSLGLLVISMIAAKWYRFLPFVGVSLVIASLLYSLALPRY